MHAITANTCSTRTHVRRQGPNCEQMCDGAASNGPLRTTGLLGATVIRKPPPHHAPQSSCRCRRRPCGNGVGSRRRRLQRSAETAAPTRSICPGNGDRGAPGRGSRASRRAPGPDHSPSRRTNRLRQSEPACSRPGPRRVGRGRLRRARQRRPGLRAERRTCGSHASPSAGGRSLRPSPDRPRRTRGSSPAGSRRHRRRDRPGARTARHRAVISGTRRASPGRRARQLLRLCVARRPRRRSAAPDTAARAGAAADVAGASHGGERARAARPARPPAAGENADLVDAGCANAVPWRAFSSSIASRDDLGGGPSIRESRGTTWSTLSRATQAMSSSSPGGPYVRALIPSIAFG